MAATRSRKMPAPMEPAQFDAVNSIARTYDAGAAGMIPAQLQRMDPEVPYLQTRKGRGGPAVSPAGRVSDFDFGTCASDRKGLGGRATVGKYGVQYLNVSQRNYSPVTLEVMQRRYIRLDKDIEYLARIKRISSQSPVKMVPEDIANILQYRMSLGVSNSDLLHDIAALKGAFSIAGKDTVDVALRLYPFLKPTGREDRLPPMDDRAFDKVFELASAVETVDWRRMRAYAVVVFALSTGMRAKELRLCNVSDINRDEATWTAIVRHPKGEHKYGRQRPVWVDPIAYPFLTRYLQAREAFVERNDLFTDALFPGINNAGGYMAGNTIRLDKALVEEELGYQFDLRMCRRTYGQRLIDRKVGVNVVSKVMGHASTATTERYYCTMDDLDAVDDISEMLPGPATDETSCEGDSEYFGVPLPHPEGV